MDADLALLFLGPIGGLFSIAVFWMGVCKFLWALLLPDSIPDRPLLLSRYGAWMVVGLLALAIALYAIRPEATSFC